MAIVRLYGAYAVQDGVEYGAYVRIPLDADEVDRHAARVCLTYDMLHEHGVTAPLGFTELVRYALPKDEQAKEVRG